MPQDLYAQLLRCTQQPAQVSKVILGLNWTLAEVAPRRRQSYGLCFSPPGRAAGINLARHSGG